MVQTTGASTSLALPESPVETHSAWASHPSFVAYTAKLEAALREIPPSPDPAAYVPPTPTPGRRHGGWQDHRLRIWDSLLAASVAPTRLRRFHDCGLAGFVQQNLQDPGKYRVVLETCRDRWCAPCAADRRNLIVGHLQEHMRRGTHRLVTLSLKSCNQGLAAQLDRLTLCFRRLRQRVLWKERVEGGLAGFEVTWNEKTSQWHPHLHAVVHGRWIGQADLSAAWKDVTGDSYIVDIRLIRHTDRVAGYVAKYATKPLPAGLQRDPERLLEAIQAYTHRRTFIQFGDWAKHAFTRRPDDGEWKTLGFIAEVIRSPDNRPGFAAIINAAYATIAEGMAIVEFTWLPPPEKEHCR